jgi:hypothetical protein
MWLPSQPRRLEQASASLPILLASPHVYASSGISGALQRQYAPRVYNGAEGRQTGGPLSAKLNMKRTPILERIANWTTVLILRDEVKGDSI